MTETRKDRLELHTNNAVVNAKDWTREQVNEWLAKKGYQTFQESKVEAVAVKEEL